MVNGDGSQTRDFVYLDDVMSGMVAAATAPNINGLVINIGCGSEVSVLDLARLVLQITGSSSNLVTTAKVSGGVSRMCANIALAEKKIKLPSFHPARRWPETDITARSKVEKSHRRMSVFLATPLLARAHFETSK